MELKNLCGLKGLQVILKCIEVGTAETAWG